MINGHLGTKQKEGFSTLRKVLTGVEHGPTIFNVMEILGKERTLHRIRSSLL
jgi:glutamyl/glutaminyl-tRNA synthetase